MTESLKKEMERIARITEANLRDIISQYRKNVLYTDELSKVIDAAEYSLLAGGKRLRPFLVHSFCNICGGNDELALAPAAALEMVHTYSLIHDDLPCMDNDDFRRGKPTNHKVFGEATAVLAGDGLLTEAFSVIANSSLTPQRKVKLISVLASHAGLLGMVGGQQIDLESEGKDISYNTLMTLQSKKTGMLFEAATLMGCIAAGKFDKETLMYARGFAMALGSAFQITDDILDVTGTSDTVGKTVGSDERDNKSTFVKLFGLDEARLKVECKIASAKVFLIQGFGQEKTQLLVDLCDYIFNRDK